MFSFLCLASPLLIYNVNKGPAPSIKGKPKPEFGVIPCFALEDQISPLLFLIFLK